MNRCGLVGPEIESGEGGIFGTFPDHSGVTPSLLYNGCRVSFRGAKRSRRGVNSFPYSADVKEIAEQCHYYIYGPSWHVLGQNLPFPFT